MFREGNEQQRAIMDLERLRQKGSAANYTADFQRVAFNTGFDEVAMRAAFYRGLKEEIKDELLHSDPATDFPSLVKLAVDIDERLYHRKMERKGQYPLASLGMRGKKGKTSGSKGNWDYGTTPMELDATTTRPPSYINNRTPGKK